MKIAQLNLSADIQVCGHAETAYHSPKAFCAELINPDACTPYPYNSFASCVAGDEFRLGAAVAIGLVIAVLVVFFVRRKKRKRSQGK